MPPSKKNPQNCNESSTRNIASSQKTTAILNAKSNDEQKGELKSCSSDHSTHRRERCSSSENSPSTMNCASLQDPHEVLRASLEFQRSSAAGMSIQRETKKKQSIPPIDPKLRNTTTSSYYSLYPSVEYVKRATSDFDLGADWHKPGVSSGKNAITSPQKIESMRVSSNEDHSDTLVNDNCRGASHGFWRLTPEMHALPNHQRRNIVSSSPTMAIESSGVVGAEAEVIVECETIHPLEEESMVRAELVHQNEDCHRQIHEHQSQIPHMNHHEATVDATGDDTDNCVSACGPSSNDEIATEATVIESGPLEKATIAAWSGHSTEALVLQQEHNSSPLGCNKYAEVDTDTNMIATVVECSAYAPEATNQSAKAELIRNPSTNDYTVDGIGIIPPSNDSIGSRVESNEQPTEATVLDSGPPDKATVDAWSTRTPGEAQVLETNISSCAVATVQDITVSNDEHAEIVDITEDFHPIELEAEGAATAQLIVGDSNTPFPESGRQEENTSVDVIAEECVIQTSCFVPVESHRSISDETSHQDAPLPATILGVENPSSADTCDNQFHKYPQKQSNTAQTLTENSSASIVGVSEQVSQLNGESTVESNSNTPLIGEGVEAPLLPQPRPFSSDPALLSKDSSRSTIATRSESTFSSVHTLTKNISRGTNNMMEILFGNTKPSTIINRKPVSFEMDSFTTSVSPRILLPSSVIYSEATQSWVATLNTSQKALDAKNVEESSKALRAFSVPTRKQAMCLARAWAPPRMHTFSSNLQCFICQSQFAVFRRACHCRNCGVCICNTCALQWPAKMIPATYNIKNEDTVNICKACDWLCSSFRLALLKGESDKAIALHATGNINLTTPFANIKGEVFYPVHCAIYGKSLSLLKWLVEDNCCPLKSIRIGNGGRGAKADYYTPILTSRSRSLLNIALSNKSIDIVRYLVVEKRMSLQDERDIPTEVLLQALDSILRVLPPDDDNEETLDEHQNSIVSSAINTSARNAINSESTSSFASEIVDNNFDSENATNVKSEDSRDTTPNNECILCCSNQIDSVVMPCGHQMCCLECSKNISRCPVCQIECSFVRVYRA